jgi:hypothetical protein
MWRRVEGLRGVTRVRHCEERVETVGGKGARRSNIKKYNQPTRRNID